MNTLLTIISTVILTGNITSIRPSFAQSGADISTTVQHLSHKAPQLNRNVLKLAVTAYKNANKKGAVKKTSTYSYRLFFTIKQNNVCGYLTSIKKRLLYNTYVAHGRKLWCE